MCIYYICTLANPCPNNEPVPSVPLQVHDIASKSKISRICSHRRRPREQIGEIKVVRGIGEIKVVRGIGEIKVIRGIGVINVVRGIVCPKK